MKDTVNAFVDIFTISGAEGGPLSGLTFGAKHQTGCPVAPRPVPLRRPRRGWSISGLAVTPAVPSACRPRSAEFTVCARPTDALI